MTNLLICNDENKGDSISEFSARAKRILEYYSLQELKIIYDSKGDFLSLRNIGKGTSEELVKFITSQHFDVQELEHIQVPKQLRLRVILSSFVQLQVKYKEVRYKANKKSILFLEDLERELHYGKLPVVDFYFFYVLLFEQRDTIFFGLTLKKYRFPVDDYIDSIRANLLSVISLGACGYEKTKFSLFEELRLMLSMRSQNILTQSNDSNEKSLFDGNYWIDYVANYKTDFLKVRSCGWKSNLELCSLRLIINKALEDGVGEFELIELDKKVSKDYLVKSKISHLFPHLKKSEVDFIYDGLKFNLYAFCNYVFNGQILKKTAKAVITAYYFDHQLLSQSKIAEISGCTRERVRQIIDVHRERYKSLIKFITDNFPDVSREDYFYSDDLLIEWSEIEHYFNASDNMPYGNIRLYLLFSGSSNSEFVFLHDLIGFNSSKLPSFNLLGSEILVKKSFADSVDFYGLLLWLNREIINLVSCEIEYDFEILLGRYLDEKSIVLEKKTMLVIVSVLRRFLNDVSNFNEVKRLKKVIYLERIINVCCNSINDAGRPLKTAELIIELTNNYIDLSRSDLLRLLNKNKGVFVMVGSGTWGLSAWREKGLIGGSIRDIVITILSERNTPVHISEILNYFKDFRAVESHSIITNLKINQNDTFQFLNCGFIGLKGAHYDSKWYNLPSVVGSRFTERVLIKILKKSGNIATFYEEEYGYPKIHTEYLIQTKFGDKYN